MYRIETTDPITGNPLPRLAQLPFVVEAVDNERLVIYFESEHNRQRYLEYPLEHRSRHYPRRAKN